MLLFDTDISLNSVIIFALSILALASIVLLEFGISLLLLGDRSFIVWGIVFIAQLSQMVSTAMIALTWADMVLRKRRAKRDGLLTTGT